ncbi:MAG TPA: PDZ domain-containing protein [Candidatus Binataceae bacterium]|nr:PDZ domain-containing protein [Candidatus Binataceae bacterium]
MRRWRIFAGLAVFAGLMTASYSIAQSVDQNSQIQSQGPGSALNQPAPQGEENDSTLELAPQPGAQRPKAEEIPSDRNFNPGADTSSLERNYKPDTENGESSRARPHGKPYLGIEVQYAEECFKGGEEYGLKVTKVDPNSPAEVAGLHAAHEPSAAGAAATTIAGIFPLVTPLIGHFAEKTHSFGNDGDLIIAVDDERIRNEDDFKYKLAQIKPGDTMYLTVLRPTSNGDHQTLKIAVRAGQWGQPIAKADPSANGDAPQ